LLKQFIVSFSSAKVKTIYRGCKDFKDKFSKLNPFRFLFPYPAGRRDTDSLPLNSFSNPLKGGGLVGAAG
jgi:hypothetical protein